MLTATINIVFGNDRIMYTQFILPKMGKQEACIFFRDFIDYCRLYKYTYTIPYHTIPPTTTSGPMPEGNSLEYTVPSEQEYP